MWPLTCSFGLRGPGAARYSPGMPGVVTGASGLVGRRAVEAFALRSPEVRAYVRSRESVEDLRAAGAKVAIGLISDVDNLRFVMAGAHTVCHLVGGLNFAGREAYEQANVASVRWVLRAARQAKVRRILFLSYPGAHPDAENAYLRAKGMAEREVLDSGLDHVILRSTHVYGPGSEWLDSLVAQARRRLALVLGSGKEVLAPVLVDDVAATLAVADDREAALSGTYGLQGPDRVTADVLTETLSELLTGRRRPRLHVRPGLARLLAGLARIKISRDAMEVLASDSLADAPDAAHEFGVTLTPLRQGLARSLGLAWA